MKVAIQGHPTRGKEVIQILESFGGINSLNLLGDNTDRYYYIYDNNAIMNIFYDPTYKSYSLEEFEKEFPFKIGDKVIHSYSPNSIGTVVNIRFDDHIPYRVDIEGKIYTCGTMSLKPYKEMQEERNITLSLEKAKEWYKKGGELKEVALQAYSEEELNKVELPKSWEEFCNNYPIKHKEYFITSFSNVTTLDVINVNRDIKTDRNLCSCKKSAEAHLALIQLEQLRDCYRQGWKPDWNNAGQDKYCVHYYQGKFKINMFWETRYFLSFPTKEMAEEFFECFRDLIEKAGDLI